MLKKRALLVTCITLSMLLIAAFGGCGSPADEPAAPSEPTDQVPVGETVTLRMATAWAETVAWNDAFWMFVEKIEEKSDGRVNFQYAGGPEAFPPFEMIEAVTNGVVDIVSTAGAYYVPQVPEADAIKLSQLAPWEERENGAYDLFNQLHMERANAFYLGRVTPHVPYHLYTNEPIDSADLSGHTVRVTPIYRAFVEALGGSTTTTAPGEVYTALERGMVETYGWPGIGIGDFGWEEVTDYVIDPGFYQVDVNILLNLDAWNALPEDIKELFEETIREVEREAYDHYTDRLVADRQYLLESGIEVIELSGAERDKYLEKAYEAGWELVIQSSPEYGPQLQELLSR